MTEIGITGKETAYRGTDWLSLGTWIRYLALVFAPGFAIMLSVFAASFVTEFVLGYQPGDEMGILIVQFIAVILSMSLIDAFIKARGVKPLTDDHPDAAAWRGYAELVRIPWLIPAVFAAVILTLYPALYLGWDFMTRNSMLPVAVTSVLLFRLYQFPEYLQAFLEEDVGPALPRWPEGPFVSSFIASVAWNICFILVAIFAGFIYWAGPVASQ